MKYTKKNVYVIIAAYNEEKHIVSVIDAIKKEGFQNIVVANDGSLDKTKEYALKRDVYVLSSMINQGKGAAVKTGCDFALQKGAKALLLIDGDGQHNPKEIKNFLKALNKGNSIVFGYREFSSTMPLMMRVGNFGLSFLSKMFYGLPIRDTQSGFRALTSAAYKKVRWKARDYGMESEMIAKASKAKLKYVQISIATIYADSFKGTTVFDGMRIACRMLKWKMLK